MFLECLCWCHFCISVAQWLRGTGHELKENTGESKKKVETLAFKSFDKWGLKSVVLTMPASQTFVLSVEICSTGRN